MSDAVFLPLSNVLRASGFKKSLTLILL